jgi:hypothetical protein
VCISPHLFRQLLRELVSLYLTLDTKEYNSVCQCLTFLDDDQRVAEILASLIGQGEVCGAC